MYNLTYLHNKRLAGAQVVHPNEVRYLHLLQYNNISNLSLACLLLATGVCLSYSIGGKKSKNERCNGWEHSVTSWIFEYILSNLKKIDK